MAAKGHQAVNPRAELEKWTEKRKTIEKELQLLEQQIYNYEGTYLREHWYGNVVHGWDAYKADTMEGVQPRELTDADRVFSNSSATSRKNIQQAEEAAPAS
eukprot:m.19984 g.19984  ORF g.19984 m.19984 type:complete len:101 (+) comp7714_c0_seq1:46-348(+)